MTSATSSAQRFLHVVDGIPGVVPGLVPGIQDCKSPGSLGKTWDRRKAMVAGAFRVGLGVSGATIVSGSCACPSHLWISRVLTSSSSLGITSLFCRATQCM